VLKKISILILMISLSGVMNVALYATAQEKVVELVEEFNEESIVEENNIVYIKTEKEENSIENHIFETAFDNGEYSLKEVLSSLGEGKYVPVLYADQFSFQSADWSVQSGMSLPARGTEQVFIDNWSGPDDLSANIKFAYDEDHLYLYAQVKDDKHAALAGSEMWRGDSIQIAFSADGVNYGSEIGLAHVNGQGQVQRWREGQAVQGVDTINLETARMEADKLTTYQASIPWKAILKEKPTDFAYFELLINQSDGTNRRGYMEWNGGIGRGKDATLFGTMELIDENADWSMWIGGKSTVVTDTPQNYKLNIPNYSNGELTLTVSIPSIGLEEEVTIPTDKAYVKEFELVFTTSGTETISVMVTEMGSQNIKTQQFKVLVNPNPINLESRFNLLEARLPLLSHKLDQAKALQIPIDYEMVKYTVLKNFIQYGRDDINHQFLQRAAYVADQLEKLFEEAEQQLEHYFNETAQAFDVPRYVTGRPDIEGFSFMADTVSTANPEKVKRPTFFIGYGHFAQVRKDISQFKDYGANIIQIEIGPQSVIQKPDELIKWDVRNSGNIDANAEITDSEFHSGTSSLHITNATQQGPNKFLRVVQTVNVKPNTTYQLSAWVKGDKVKSTWFGGGPNWSIRQSFPTGTYDWREVTRQFTTAENQTKFELMILTEDAIGAVWVDDLTLIEVGSSTNLVTNGDFESPLQPEQVAKWKVSTNAIENNIIKVLDEAAEHDIAVTLLISPHYFPAWALSKWPELKNNQTGFIKYNIHHPIARELIKDYLNALIPLVKDKPALHSITLSNEPVYQAHLDNTQLEQWQTYLEQIHVSIARLNEVNSTEYTSFSNVPIPALNAKTPLAYDWIQFNNQLFSSWHVWMADIVREVTEDVPLHVKMMMTNELPWGIDPEQFSELSDINGNDGTNYLSEGKQGFLKQSRYYDLQSSLKKAPVFNSEDHIIRDGDVQYIPGQAIHTSANMWQGGIHGRNATTIWVWERTYEENDFKGSVLHRPDVVAGIGKVNLDLNRLAEEVTAFQNEQTEAVILSSQASRFYSSNYEKATTASYEAASLSGVKVGFVTEKQIANGSLLGKKVLIVPDATHVYSSTLEEIKQFAEAGGKVLLVGTNALKYNEHNEEQLVEKRQAIIELATTVHSAIGAELLRTQLLPILTQQNMLAVKLFDVATGELVSDVEWRSVMYEGKRLINIINLSSEIKNIEVEVNDVKIHSWINVINGELGSSSEVKLESFVPILIEVNEEQEQE